MSVVAYRLDKSENVVCVVVGLGLVGTATAASLRLLGSQLLSNRPAPVDWSDSNSVFSAITSALGSVRPRLLELVWSAGKSGFSASDAELSNEYRVYEEVIGKLANKYKELAVSLVSSAGGLYEGNGGARRHDDKVSPVRPYAKWKHAQENLLKEYTDTCRIYRVSTVYGASQKRARYGIMNALIESSYANRVATIYASANTLRDYVSHLDVSRHIVRRLGCMQSRTEVLASGRPTSIDALANLIERSCGRRLKITYFNTLENDRDIVFHKCSVAKEFEACSLEEGVLGLVSTYKLIKFGSPQFTKV